MSPAAPDPDDGQALLAPLLRKLNLRAGTPALWLGVPDDVRDLFSPWPAPAPRERAQGQAGFGLAFAITQAELDERLQALADHCPGDAVLWIAYPKQTSRRYRGEFNRDSGWDRAGQLGLEPVRMVAIDADWSALRLRRVQYIRQRQRNRAQRPSA
ncbi:hypothetical protein P6166_00460 [Stenotrophomonas sp. HITSZ_GD]|uniref:hypothetical protein n=1 Tax=Stenotrophomonas sp. HITSZ_GD TaxID=3037248 RepID=UPI00240E9150|nr:hypothetical protein [Stenotrophomonas sp. HITSZ_GD]MDG2523832.1 hypothetical protein [Stenotrophomonas sp. HITSZ_GD]